MKDPTEKYKDSIPTKDIKEIMDAVLNDSVSKNTVREALRKIESYELSADEKEELDEDSIKWGMKIAYDIIEEIL